MQGFLDDFDRPDNAGYLVAAGDDALHVYIFRSDDYRETLNTILTKLHRDMEGKMRPLVPVYVTPYDLNGVRLACAPKTLPATMPKTVYRDPPDAAYCTS